MKGIIFTEFLEMVEGSFAPEIVDRVIENSDLASGGVYTAVGTYDDQEMVSLVVNLSKETGLPLPDLLKTYGEYLFGRFTVLYPHFFSDVETTFDLLNVVESYIHVEVCKLYPEAVTPSLDCQQPDAASLTMMYRSSRGLPDVAEGLIVGCAKHFGEQITIERDDQSDGAGTEVLFKLSHVH